jgi:hypothetical protein
MELVVGILVAGWLLANVLATRLVLRDIDAEGHQRWVQLLAVWLVPVIGAVVIFGIHRRSEASPRKYPEAEEPSAGLIDAHQVGRSIRSTSDD